MFPKSEVSLYTYTYIFHVMALKAAEHESGAGGELLIFGGWTKKCERRCFLANSDGWYFLHSLELRGILSGNGNDHPRSH